MNRTIEWTVVWALVLPGLLLARDAMAASQEECEATLSSFMELGNVSELFAESYGYAVLPTIGKAGVGIGGAIGEGCVYAQGKYTGNVRMTQLSIGLQLGGQAYSQLVMFKNSDTYDEFVGGGFQFGADASAVALTYGAAAAAGTQGASATAGEKSGVGTWTRGMAVYTLAKGGLMYQATIGGQKYKFHPPEE